MSEKIEKDSENEIGKLNIVIKHLKKEITGWYHRGIEWEKKHPQFEAMKCEIDRLNSALAAAEERVRLERETVYLDIIAERDAATEARDMSEDQNKALIADNAALRERLRVVEERPKIVCLCGSTRFTAEMLVIQWELTKQGKIVLSWCALPDSYFTGPDKTHIGDQEGVKELVDEIHKRKIDLADEVFVININGYVGDSTRSEIAYAQKVGKPVLYLQAIEGREVKVGV